MGSNKNIGGQQISWKYSTPLKGEYLSSMFGGISEPGLLSRPNITVSPLQNKIANVEISRYSLFIEPYDKETNVVDGIYGNKYISNLVHIDFTTNYTFNIYDTTVAIGFRFSFKSQPDEVESQDWYGEYVALDSASVRNFKGVIIASVIYFSNNNSWIVSTNGADLTESLISKEGQNPNFWLSPKSPRRIWASSTPNYGFEIRSHNNLWKGYYSGPDFYKYFESATIDLNSNPLCNFDQCIVRFTGNGLSCIQQNVDVSINSQTNGAEILGNIMFVIKGYNLVSNKCYSINSKIYPVINYNINNYERGGTLYYR